MSQDRPPAWGYFSFHFKFCFFAITLKQYTNSHLLPPTLILPCLSILFCQWCNAVAFSARNVEIQFMLVFLVERVNINTSSNIKTDQAQGNKVLLFFFSPSPCWFRFIMVTGWKPFSKTCKCNTNRERMLHPKKCWSHSLFSFLVFRFVTPNWVTFIHITNSTTTTTVCLVSTCCRWECRPPRTWQCLIKCIT